MELRLNLRESSCKLLAYLWVVFSLEDECKEMMERIALPKVSDEFMNCFLESRKVRDWIRMRCQININALSRKNLDSTEFSKLFQMEILLYKNVLKELN